MQDILPPSRGRIRPIVRTNPQRAYPSTLRRPIASTPNPLVAVAPQPPSNPNPAPIKHRQPQQQPPATHPSQPRLAKDPDPRPRHHLPRALSRTAYKLHLIHRLNERQQQSHKIKHATPKKRKATILKQLNKRSLLTSAAITLILVITGYVSFDTWQTNNLAKQAFAKEASASESPALSPADRQSSEGKDESSLPASTLADYRVAPNLPRALYINKLNVAARVLPMGVNKDSSMQAPLGIYDAGWYSGSVRPGETGAMVLNGHSSGPTRQGLLGRLDTLKQGDEIVIEKGDTSRLTYRVVHTETVPLEAVDMNKVALPYGTAKSGLNIYTCTGEWLPTKQTFDHRVIVYTVEV